MTTTPWTSAPPVPVQPPASLRVDRAADVGVLAACAVVAIGADVALRSIARPGLAAALVIAVGCASVMTTGRFLRRHARALLVLAPLLTAFLALRTNPAVLVPVVLGAAFLVALAASLARGGSLFDLTFPGIVGRLGLTLTHAFLVPAFLLRPLGRMTESRPQWRALVRGLAIGIPVMVAIGALLASADAVFASLLRLPDTGDLALHVGLLGFGACVAATVLRHASAQTADLPLGSTPALGRVEARIVLAGLCGIFAAFVASQVAAATGAADRILTQEGLTYAEYARQGFFQLLAAAGLTAVVLLCVRACGSPEDRVSTALILVAVALTEVVVALAVHRLSLYEDAYGLTLLRLAAVAAAVWVGLVFLLIGMAAAGVGAGRSWLPGAVVTAALVGLLTWSVANPAALVARRDLERATLDPHYLASLGDDAVPTIAARLGHLDPAVSADVVRSLCGNAPSASRGLLAWNRSAIRASQARATIGC